MFEKWNIKEELTEERVRLAPEYDPVTITRAILIEQEYEDCRIQDALGSSGCGELAVDESLLDQGRIYTLNEIRKIAIQYRLRFLPSKYFIGEIPYDAIIEIKRLRELTGADINKFRILAPSRRFELEDENADPLLFAPLTNGKYYLIHQWGNDLAWYKKIVSYPMRSFGHMARTILVVALLITLITPNDLVVSSARIEIPYFGYHRLMLYFHTAILLCAITVLSSFVFKLFPSDYIWKKKTF